MAPQATRISLVFGCLVIIFFGFRSLTVPESFGKTGHYRGAAVKALASRDVKFEGKQPCIDCHANNSPHTDKGVSCETCHGPGAAHTKDFDAAKLETNTSRSFCGRCHAMNSARRDTFPQVDMADHHANQRCVDCHKMHPEDAAKSGDSAKPADTAKPTDAAKPAEPAKPVAAPPTKAAAAAPVATPPVAKPVAAAPKQGSAK